MTKNYMLEKDETMMTIRDTGENTNKIFKSPKPNNTVAKELTNYYNFFSFDDL